MDEYQMLIYCVEIPSHIADLPYINDYLTRDFAFIPKYEGNESQIFIAQACGQPIIINYYCDKNSYFIYDCEEHKEIMRKEPSIEGNSDISIDAYISAKIEAYQQKTGCFGDVIIMVATIDIIKGMKALQKRIINQSLTNLSNLITTKRRHNHGTIINRC
jgi:cyclophilin family peptidyl-prolyl cis-trans isomerase